MDFNVFLKIETNDEIIEIPFVNLECLDLFTVRYENRDELITFLNDILDLRLDEYSIRNVYVEYQYYSKDKKLKEKSSFVKYAKDDFNKDMLGEAFKEFLCYDHERIRKTGVYGIRSEAMLAFKSGRGRLSTFDINFAVNRYLYNAKYRIYREIYFDIRDIVKVSINSKKKNNGNALHDYSKVSSNDKYVSYLLEVANKSDEDRERAIEELSLYDMDELSRMISSKDVIFDGMDIDYNSFDLNDLETCTGIDIDGLRQYIHNNRNSGHRR